MKRDSDSTPQVAPEVEQELRVAEAARHAAGVPAVAIALRQAVRQMGPVRTARTLTKVNQHGGFDCMSCAWPDPETSLVRTRPHDVIAHSRCRETVR